MLQFPAELRAGKARKGQGKRQGTLGDCGHHGNARSGEGFGFLLYFPDPIWLNSRYSMDRPMDVEAICATAGQIHGVRQLSPSAAVAHLLRRGAGPQFGLGPALSFFTEEFKRPDVAVLVRPRRLLTEGASAISGRVRFSGSEWTLSQCIVWVWVMAPLRGVEIIPLTSIPLATHAFSSTAVSRSAAA